MTSKLTRSYLRNVIISCIFEEFIDDARTIDVANRIEEAVTRLFSVSPIDIGGMDPKTEDFLMSHSDMLEETDDDKPEGVF